MPNITTNSFDSSVLDLKAIRVLKAQLTSTDLMPAYRFKFVGYIHPVTAVQFMWSAGRYWLALKLWYNVWTSFDANLILNSIPWRD